MPTQDAMLHRIDERVNTIRDDVKEVKELILAQNGRVRTLEIEAASNRGSWKVITVVGTLAGTFGGFLVQWLRGG